MLLQEGVIMLFVTFVVILVILPFSRTTQLFREIPVEKVLQETILSNYNPLVRPVANYSDRLKVHLRFKLMQIVDLNIKDQFLSLDIRVVHRWQDYKLQWDPDDFQGITQIGLPADKIWLPSDISLTNSLGDPRMNLQTADIALVSHDGTIFWVATTILKALCPIEVEYYPFDIQKCSLKFISWTYDSNSVYITLMDLPEANGTLQVGMDMSEFYLSGEWDLIELPAKVVENYYDCCPGEPYVDILFNVTLRRQSRFYLVNFIMPLVGISYLSLLVFHLPVESGEKVTLCVSALTAQIMFLLLMMDNIPVTSLAVPLLGKLIIFNMLLVFLSILCTVVVLNVHYRSHDMARWLKMLVNFRCFHLMLFISPTHKMPPKDVEEITDTSILNEGQPEPRLQEISRSGSQFLEAEDAREVSKRLQVGKVIQNVDKVKNYVEELQSRTLESDHWKLAAVILDRIFMIAFNVVYIIGTVKLLSDAPALYDKRVSMQWDYNN